MYFEKLWCKLGNHSGDKLTRIFRGSFGSGSYIILKQLLAKTKQKILDDPLADIFFYKTAKNIQKKLNNFEENIFFFILRATPVFTSSLISSAVLQFSGKS